MKIWKPTENTAYNSTFTCNYVTQQPYTITTSKQRHDSAIQEHVNCKMTNGRNAAIICCKIKYRTIPSFCLKHAYGLQCRFICNRIRNFFHVSMHCAHQNNFCEVRYLLPAFLWPNKCNRKMYGQSINLYLHMTIYKYKSGVQVKWEVLYSNV